MSTINSFDRRQVLRRRTIIAAGATAMVLATAGCGMFSRSRSGSDGTSGNTAVGSANMAAPMPMPSTLPSMPAVATSGPDVTQRAGSYEMRSTAEILSSGGIEPEALANIRDRLNSIPVTHVCAAAGPGGQGILNSMRSAGCQISDQRSEGGHVTAHLACTFGGSPAEGDINALVTETSTMAEATFNMQHGPANLRYRQTITYTRAGDCDASTAPEDNGGGDRGSGDDQGGEGGK